MSSLTSKIKERGQGDPGGTHAEKKVQINIENHNCLMREFRTGFFAVL
jgi:hypothetical protein